MEAIEYKRRRLHRCQHLVAAARTGAAAPRRMLPQPRPCRRCAVPHDSGLQRCGSASNSSKPARASVTMPTQRCSLRNWPSMSSAGRSSQAAGSCAAPKMTCAGGGGRGQGGGGFHSLKALGRLAPTKEPWFPAQSSTTSTLLRQCHPFSSFYPHLEGCHVVECIAPAHRLVALAPLQHVVGRQRTLVGGGVAAGTRRTGVSGLDTGPGAVAVCRLVITRSGGRQAQSALHTSGVHHSSSSLQHRSPPQSAALTNSARSPQRQQAHHQQPQVDVTAALAVQQHQHLRSGQAARGQGGVGNASTAWGTPRGQELPLKRGAHLPRCCQPTGPRPPAVHPPPVAPLCAHLAVDGAHDVLEEPWRRLVQHTPDEGLRLGGLDHLALTKSGGGREGRWVGG